MTAARTLLITATCAVGLAACAGQAPRSGTPMTDAQRLDEEIEHTDRDARAQIPPTFDRRLVGSWSCRGYDWSAGNYVLTFGSNAIGSETHQEAGKPFASPFRFGTFGASLYEYARGSMPSDEAYSVRGKTLELSGNLYWKEGDGWIAVPEVSKSVCRRAQRTGSRT